MQNLGKILRLRWSDESQQVCIDMNTRYADRALFKILKDNFVSDIAIFVQKRDIKLQLT